MSKYESKNSEHTNGMEASIERRNKKDRNPRRRKRGKSRRKIYNDKSTASPSAFRGMKSGKERTIRMKVRIGTSKNKNKSSTGTKRMRASISSRNIKIEISVRENQKNGIIFLRKSEYFSWDEIR